MYVNNTNGNALSANASIEIIDGITGIVLESRGGAQGSSNERNIDYRPALDAILIRLSEFSSTVIVHLVSTFAMKFWSNMNDRLIIEIPINKNNIVETRAIITASIQNKKRSKHTKGGNPTKRILISANISNDKLQYLITGKHCKLG